MPRFFPIHFLKVPYFREIKRSSLTLGLLSIFVWVEWRGRKGAYAIESPFDKQPRFIRWLFYAMIAFLIGMYAQTDQTAFIYFQF